MRNILAFLLLVLTAGWNVPDLDARAALTSPDKPLESYIYVTGAVHSPGHFKWTHGMNVSDSIQAAGGFVGSGDWRLKIYHALGTASETYVWRNTMDNIKPPPKLQPGDAVVVAAKIFPSTPKQPLAN